MSVWTPAERLLDIITQLSVSQADQPARDGARPRRSTHANANTHTTTHTAD